MVTNSGLAISSSCSTQQERWDSTAQHSMARRSVTQAAIHQKQELANKINL